MKIDIGTINRDYAAEVETAGGNFGHEGHHRHQRHHDIKKIGQERLLSFLLEQDGISQKDLADLFQKSHPLR